MRQVCEELASKVFDLIVTEANSGKLYLHGNQFGLLDNIVWFSDHTPNGVKLVELRLSGPLSVFSDNFNALLYFEESEDTPGQIRYYIKRLFFKNGELLLDISLSGRSDKDLSKLLPEISSALAWSARRRACPNPGLEKSIQTE